jgi:aspartyl-tRNA(Asn)/glutamyl-tRNA(Gln) amidotransferase subunit A
MKDLKIGYAPVDFTDRAEPPARAAFAAALAALKDTGAQMVETKLPDFPYGPVLSTILNGEMGSIFEPLIASSKVNELADAPQIAGLKASQDVAAKDYLKAMRIRRLIQAEFSKFFGDLDVLLAPGRPGPAVPVTQDLDAPGFQVLPDTPPGTQGIIPAGNLAGLPALVLPCGFAGRLPVALQLVGVPFSENTLLAVGREFQSRTDWHKRRPPA